MSPSEIRKAVIPPLLSFIASLICIFFAFKLSANETNAKEIQAKLDSKAEITYVDKQDFKIEKKCESDVKALKELYQTDILYIRGALERLLDEREHARNNK
jgi:hypothetical protein